MAMSDDFESLIERRRESGPRVHVDLTERFRERLLQILATIDAESKAATFARLFERLGYSEVQESIYPEADHSADIVDFVGRKTSEAEGRTILNADTELVLSFVEYLLKIYQENIPGNAYRKSKQKELRSVVSEIRRALESEGILWELNPDEDGFVRFEQMGSEAMQEADEEVRGLMQGTVWEEPLRGYNEAYELYLDRKYGKEIPEKLYNSIEAVVTTICVDLEGWEDNKDRNLKHYLDVLREEEVFAPNPIMKAEVGDLVNSMERAFSKAGNDRKNRHELIDRRYCTLMLHQVSAYLVFIIKRYEDEYRK